MKKIFITLIVIGCLLAMGSLSNPFTPGEAGHLTTIQTHGIAVATVTADATARDANDQSSWADAVSLCTPIKANWNGVCLSFYGYGDGAGAGDPNDSTFSFDVYVCDLYGGLECVSYGNTGTIGTQELSHNPETGEELNGGDPNSSYRWADDLNEGTVRWSKTIMYSDYQSTEGRAKMKFDRQESFGIYVRIYNMTSQDITSITCILNGY